MIGHVPVPRNPLEDRTPCQWPGCDRFLVYVRTNQVGIEGYFRHEPRWSAGGRIGRPVRL